MRLVKQGRRRRGPSEGRRAPIFLSYRRGDTAGHAGRLHDALARHFGPSQVFQDISGIGQGADFRAVIDGELASCRAVVVVIGQDWLSATDGDGRRRIDDPVDVLRLEVASALHRDIFVVPVLVEGARMPAKAEMPEPMQRLADRNAVEVTDRRWDDDVAELTRALEAVVKPARGRPSLRRIAAAGLTLVTAAGTILGIYWGLVPFFRHTAGPGPMKGDLNIAVAPFREVRADGKATPSSQGDALAATLFDRLDAELRPLQEAGFVIDRRAPSITPAIDGVTREQRATAARKIADRIHADVVVYGAVDDRASGAEVVPEFYLRESRVQNAEELAGQHELGAAVQMGGSLANPVVAKMVRDRLLSRINAMTQLVIGLGYYAVDGHYDEALQHFDAAQEEPGWDDKDGKEVLYVFIGNAAQKVGDLDRAQAAYARSVAINPDYARGRLGVAEAIFQRAKGRCEAGAVDAPGLERAANAFQDAASARLQPAFSDIPVKVDVGLGRVFVCQSQALVVDRWQAAEAAFGRAVAAYEGGNERIRTLAAEAYAGLGLVDLPAAGSSDRQERFERSATDYRKAIAASTMKDRTAEFYAMLGFISERLGRPADADTAYDRAVQLAADPAVRARYEDARVKARTSGAAP